MPRRRLSHAALVFAAVLAAAEAELLEDPARTWSTLLRDDTALLQTGSSRAEGQLARPEEASSAPKQRRMTFDEWRHGPSSGAVTDEEDETWRSSNLTKRALIERDIHINIPNDLALKCSKAAISLAPESRAMIPVDVCSPGNSSYNNMVQALAGGVDLVYYLCIDCASFKIPEAFRGKAMLVDGLKSDDCLGAAVLALGNISQHSNLSYRDSRVGHLRKVTAAHKLIIAHAQLSGKGKVAVFEEDFTMRETGCTRPEPEFHSLVSDIERVQPTFLRLTSSCYLFRRSPHPPCRLCQCKSAGEHVCLVRPGCTNLHNSGAYILNSSRYDTFLRAPGIIDSLVQAQLQSTVILPVLGYQPHYYEFYPLNERTFTENCLVNDWQ